MYMEMARVPHPPAIPKAHVDALRGRYERRECGRHRGRRRRSKPTALLSLQGFVLIQRDNHDAKLEHRVDHVACKSNPLGVEVSLEGGGQMDGISLAADADARSE